MHVTCGLKILGLPCIRRPRGKVAEAQNAAQQEAAGTSKHFAMLEKRVKEMEKEQAAYKDKNEALMLQISDLEIEVSRLKKTRSKP